MNKVTISGNYFTAGGHRFIPIGVNWVPSVEGMQWPYEWNPENIEADFAAMASLGINFIRFDLVWAWIEPLPGQYNEKAFEQLDFLIELAHKYQIYLNPAFFIGGEVGDAFWDVPWRNGRHPHDDAEMLRRQADHIAEFGRRYHDEAAIIAWDLTDEPPFWMVSGSTTDAMAANWTRLLCQSLRSTDPHHLILCGTAAQEVFRGPFRIDNIKEWVDFSSVHPYPIFQPLLYSEPLLSTRMTYAAAFETKLSMGANKPVLMQEFGASSAMYGPDRLGQYYRTMMYSALGAGSMGLIAWCATDAHPEFQFKRAPYIRNPHETQFGITDYQRNPRPHGLEMAKIRKVIDQIDLSDIEPVQEEGGIPIPHEWAHGFDYNEYGFPSDTHYQYISVNILDDHTDTAGNTQLIQACLSSFILCRQAGLSIGFPREKEDWQKSKLLLTPSPLINIGGYHLFVTFWQKALSWVGSGGHLYASLSAMSALPIPTVVDLFGVQIDDRLPWCSTVKIKFIEDFHGIRKGEVFEFQAPNGLEFTGAKVKLEGAKVIAEDQNGNPAILIHTNKFGQTALCTYPLEAMLGKTPNVFEGESSFEEFYRSLKKWAGIHSPYSVDNSSLELGVLAGKNKDYVILVNHSGNSENGNITAKTLGFQVDLLTPDGRQTVKVQDNGWEYTIEPFSGLVFEVIRL